VLLATRGCGHGDGNGEDDDLGVMLERDDDGNGPILHLITTDADR
jgi:hypothetical protein